MNRFQRNIFRIKSLDKGISEPLKGHFPIGADGQRIARPTIKCIGEPIKSYERVWRDRRLLLSYSDTEQTQRREDGS